VADAVIEAVSSSGYSVSNFAGSAHRRSNPALQLSALKQAWCKSIFTAEGLAGAMGKRPARTRCLKALRPGDTLLVWKRDR
jgi:DNA invertase Pin-like site-specific DNA recombinase